MNDYYMILGLLAAVAVAAFGWFALKRSEE